MAIIEIQKTKQGERKFAYKNYQLRILGRSIAFFKSKNGAVAWLLGILCLVIGGPCLLWWLVSGSQSAKHETEQRNELTIRDNTFGCRTVEEFRRLADLGASRDYAEFEKQLKARIATQTCRQIPAGAKAHRDGHSNQHGADRVRLEGETGHWWITAR